MAGIPEKICAYLRKNEEATTLELSQALECTPANIRHHLANLERKGLVSLARSTPGRSRGRPVQVFCLASSAREQNLEGLASALLAAIFEGEDHAEINLRLARAASLMAGTPAPAGMHLTRRLNHTVRRLQDLKYHPRWEAHADGPRLYLVHCPYSALIPRYSQALCQFDACLLTTLLGVPATRITDPGTHPCIFSIG